MTDEETTPADRLKQARIRAGYATAADAARAFGWQVPAYRHHENGTRRFNHELAARYGRAFKTSAAWLAGLRDDEQQPDWLKHVEIRPSLREVPSELVAQMLDDYDLVFLPELDLHDVFSSSPESRNFDGTGKVHVFNKDILLPLTNDINGLAVIVGFDNSMGPTIERGDLVLVDTQYTGLDRSREIWAFHHNGLAMIRRVKGSSQDVMVAATRGFVEEVFIDEGEMDILGPIVWIGKKVPTLF